MGLMHFREVNPVWNLSVALCHSVWGKYMQDHLCLPKYSLDFFTNIRDHFDHESFHYNLICNLFTLTNIVNTTQKAEIFQARFKYLKTRMKSKIKSLPMVSGIMGAGLASVLCSSILTLSSLRTFSDLSPFSVSDLLFNFSHFNLQPFLQLGFLPFLLVCTSTQRFVPSSLSPA